MTKAYNVSSRTKRRLYGAKDRNGDKSFYLNIWGRYLDNIHGIDCLLSGPQGLILVYICKNDEEVYQKDIEKYF